MTNRQDRQKLVRETLDRQTEMTTVTPRTRCAYIVFAAVVLTGIVFSVAANASEGPSPCKFVANRLISTIEEQMKVLANTPAKVADANKMRANFHEFERMFEKELGREMCAQIALLPEPMFFGVLGIQVVRGPDYPR